MIKGRRNGTSSWSSRPAGSEAWGGDLQERIDEARQRARAACDSIELPGEGAPRVR